MPNLTSAEVCAKYKVSGRTLLRMVKAEELPHVAKFPTRTGGYLFDADVTAEFFARRGAVGRRRVPSP